MPDTSTSRGRVRTAVYTAHAGEIAVAALLIYAGATSDAAAYIDPGSGGAIITGILGFFAAVAYTTRKYWYRLKRAFTGKGDQSDKPPPR
jgi:hypothetical protein